MKHLNIISEYQLLFLNLSVDCTIIEGWNMNYILMVYGSLRKGGEFHHYLEGADFIDSDILGGFLMTEEEGYPVIYKSASRENTVFVELYRIDDYHLTETDILEGYHGPGMDNEYERIAVQSSKGYKGYVYCGGNNSVINLKNQIQSGDWFNKN
jgi:gamma-glutamylcyclotransferase (GGCT)/AIG2-like uncharacterized protein YtfP